MKYLITGSGGTGGCIGGYMTRSGLDVTMIARNAQLEAIKQNGLTLDTTAYGEFTVYPKVTDTGHYDDIPDVIFVCVKGYSLGDVMPFLRKVSNEKTIIIPILNIYGTGEALQKEIPGSLVTDGCIYVASNIEAPGRIKMHGDIFRVVFGVRDKNEERPELAMIRDDLTKSGITALLSDNIKRDALLKFSYVSAQAACGLYYGVTAGDIQSKPEIRTCFASLVAEIGMLAEKMGIDFGQDIVKRNLDILDDLLPSSSTSMQRDIENGKQSEIDGLVYSVERMAESCGLELPTYKKLCQFFKKTY